MSLYIAPCAVDDVRLQSVARELTYPGKKRGYAVRCGRLAVGRRRAGSVLAQQLTMRPVYVPFLLGA